MKSIPIIPIIRVGDKLEFNGKKVEVIDLKPQKIVYCGRKGAVGELWTNVPFVNVQRGYLKDIVDIVDIIHIKKKKKKKTKKK